MDFSPTIRILSPFSDVFIRKKSVCPCVHFADQGSLMAIDFCYFAKKNKSNMKKSEKRIAHRIIHRAVLFVFQWARSWHTHSVGMRACEFVWLLSMCSVEFVRSVLCEYKGMSERCCRMCCHALPKQLTFDGEMAVCVWMYVCRHSSATQPALLVEKLSLLLLLLLPLPFIVFAKPLMLQIIWMFVACEKNETN